jgi:lincosamide nucleotidyltransferase B/F
MAIQESMIELVRTRCRADHDLVAALMYGSFALGAGDAFSDIEFVS